jgi:hypothetical protein
MVPPIVVSGIPRSGTSWVAKTLSFAPGYTYYREPDNSDHVPGAEPWFRFRYLPEGVTDDVFATHMGRALHGEVATSATMAEAPGPLLGRLPPRLSAAIGNRVPALYLRRDGVLLKVIHCNLALEWFARAAPDVRLVVVVRHPCATFASWRRQGWAPDVKRLLDDQRLLDDHLAPYAELIAGAKGFWEQAGAFWGALTLVVTRQLTRHPEWLPVQHEWLCEAPVERFRLLYEAVGVPWVDGAEEFLVRADRGGNTATQSLQRSSRDERDKWRAEVDLTDQDACRRIVERFELPWYPDFDTTVEPPRWLS